MTDKKEEFTPTVDASKETASDMFTAILKQKVEEGALEKAISAKVDKLIDEVASDVFRSYSDVGKVLKEKLTESIMPKMEDLSDLPQYHDVVMSRLKIAANDFRDKRLVEVLDKELSDIATELPEEIEFSWLVEQVLDSAKEEAEYAGEMTLIIENERDGYIHVCLDKEANKDKWRCEIRFQARQVNKDKPEEKPKFEMFALNIDDNKRYGQSLAFGTHYRFEKKLVNLYAMKGTITLNHGYDADDYDTSWGDY